MLPRLPPEIEPADLLVRHTSLFLESPLPGPVLDLACGEGQNGLFLAALGLDVVFLDHSKRAMDRVRRNAFRSGLKAEFRITDLEDAPAAALEQDAYGGILVFRYLHRPLIPFLQGALKSRGVLIYETFTADQPRFGRPRNPAFLLRPGELRGWFKGWDIVFAFEGVLSAPVRAAAQIVCRKP